jgi:hypothetical protein
MIRYQGEVKRLLPVFCVQKREKPAYCELFSYNEESYYTGSKNVSGCPGSKISFAHMSVTRFSVSLTLMIL